jgi:hypothetical protein
MNYVYIKTKTSDELLFYAVKWLMYIVIYYKKISFFAHMKLNLKVSKNELIMSEKKTRIKLIYNM